MYQIKKIKNKNIFYIEIFGKITHIQIIEFLEKITEINTLERNLNLITDYNKAIIDESSIDPIENIGIFINTKMKNKFEHIRWANLSINYLPTTGAILLNKMVQGKGFEYEPFSTLEKAMDWIDLTKDDLCNFEKIN